MSVNKLVLISCATLALSVAGSAHAARFFFDQFDYADGDLTTYDGTAGFGGDNVSGGNWATYSPLPPATLNPGSIQVVNGRAVVSEPGTEDAERRIPNPATEFMTAGETWYYAAKVTVNDQRATPATTPVQQEYFMLLKDASPAGLRSRLYVNNPSTGTGGAGYRLAIGASSGAANAVNWGSDLAFGQEYTVVGSYEFDTGHARLWVNPADMSSPSVLANMSPSASTAIDALGLRQAFFGGGAANTQILIDAAALADNFDEALAGLAIPEPATLALAGLAGLAMAAAGRRRS
jgi:hypothetical protein